MPNKYSLKKESENNIEGKHGKLSPEKGADVASTWKLLRTESNPS